MSWVSDYQPAEK